MYRRLFKRKSTIIPVAECSFMDIGDGQVNSYFRYLKKKYHLRNLSYEAENKNGLLRCIIKTHPGNKQAIMYFKDRCPAMIEIEIKEHVMEKEDIKNREDIETACFITESPYGECYTLCDENGNLIKPMITVKCLMQHMEGDHMIFEYICRIAIPKFNSYRLDNNDKIRDFFLYVLESQITEESNTDFKLNNVRRHADFPKCIEFEFAVNDSSIFFEYMKEIAFVELHQQKNNKLNIKLREFLNSDLIMSL